MKRTVFWWTLALVVAVLAPSFAQSERDQKEITRAVIQTEKKAIVAANMRMSEAESTAFWPVYDEYQRDLQALNERTIQLIDRYAKAYDTMTDADADTFLKEYLGIEKDRLSLREGYLPKFRSVLSSKLVTRFYQIENKLEAIIKYELVEAIPLVK